MMKGSGLDDKRVSPNPSVVFTDLEDGSAVLLDLDSKFYYSLNDTGCFMWKVFEENGAIEADKLVEELLKEYDVDESQARRDVEEFISGLAKEGLIRLS